MPFDQFFSLLKTVLHQCDKIHFSLPNPSVFCEICIFYSFYWLYLISGEKETLDIIYGKFSENIENGMGIHCLPSVCSSVLKWGRLYNVGCKPLTEQGENHPAQQL